MAWLLANTQITDPSTVLPASPSSTTFSLTLMHQSSQLQGYRSVESFRRRTPHKKTPQAQSDTPQSTLLLAARVICLAAHAPAQRPWSPDDLHMDTMSQSSADLCNANCVLQQAREAVHVVGGMATCYVLIQVPLTRYAAGYDQVKGREVHLDVERHAVVRDPALCPHTNGCHLAAVHPHPCKPRQALPIQI